MPKTRTFLGFIVAAVLGVAAALGVAACGSDDENTTGESVAVEEADTVDIRLSDDRIDPEDVKVRAGVIEFVVRNDGDGEHAFAIETSDGSVKETEPIAPGESARLKIDLRPGTYDMYDPVGDNRAQGLEGKVKVDERKTDTVTETNETTDTATDEETVTKTNETTDTETDQRTVTETDERTVTETETETETTTTAP